MERVLGVHPRLDGVSFRRGGRLEEVALAGSQAQHPLDEIDAVHRLGHPMLDLQPSVDLEERHRVAIHVDEELDGAGRAIVDRAGQAPPRRWPGSSRTESREVGRRRLLHDLLVATLGRTVPIAEDHDLAGTVAEHLDLDVTGAAYETFEEHRIGSEARPPRSLDRCEAIGERRRRPRTPACRFHRRPPPL